MRASNLPRPVFDIKGWTTRSSLDSPSLTDDITSNDAPLGLDFTLFRPTRLNFIKFLGSGSFGCVYLAQDIGQTGDQDRAPAEDDRREAKPPRPHPELEPPRLYAVKCMKNSQVSRQSRLQEVEAHRAALGHPGVLELYACVQQDGWTFLVFEYVDSGDMAQCIENFNPYAHSDDLIRSVFGQVVDAVQHCHQRGVFHRDIKPENIMCRKGATQVALGDFGWRALKDVQGLATRESVNADFRTGSKHFMSPECLKHGYLAQGVRPKNWKPSPFDSAKSDIWSLGMLLSAMVCNGAAWRRADPTDDGFMHYLEHPLNMREALALSWTAFVLLRGMLTVDPSSRMSIYLVKNKLRDVRTFRMSPWELEGASLDARDAAEKWLPQDYTQPMPQPWTRYATYPDHLDLPDLNASPFIETESHRTMRDSSWPCLWETESFGRVASEDVVRSLSPSRVPSRNRTNQLITPDVVDIIRPLISEDSARESDLADGLEVYADRLGIQKWISDCAAVVEA